MSLSALHFSLSVFTEFFFQDLKINYTRKPKKKFKRIFIFTLTKDVIAQND